MKVFKELSGDVMQMWNYVFAATTASILEKCEILLIYV